MTVSVIIPVRNGKDYIGECLDSVLSQDYQALEVIVIDDGSTDFDYQTLYNRDNRIKVIRLEGFGVSRARNTGMAYATGNYIAFLDADDIWFPGKISAQVRYLEAHPDVGCVFGRFRRWEANEDGTFAPASELVEACHSLTECEPERSGWIYTLLLTGLLVGMNTAMIRREVFQLLGGFDDSMRIGEDYLFWLKVSRIYEMHSLDGAVALYRIHGGSAMRRLDVDNHQVKMLKTAVARWGLCNPDGSSLAEVIYSKRIAECEFTHGYNHFWRGSGAVARRSFLAAMRGGVLPTRSFIYVCLTPIRRMLGVRQT